MIKDDRFCSLMLCKSRIIVFLIMQTFIFSSNGRKEETGREKITKDVNMGIHSEIVTEQGNRKNDSSGSISRK